MRLTLDHLIVSDRPIIKLDSKLRNLAAHPWREVFKRPWFSTSCHKSSMCVKREKMSLIGPRDPAPFLQRNSKEQFYERKARPPRRRRTVAGQWRETGQRSREDGSSGSCLLAEGALSLEFYFHNANSACDRRPVFRLLCNQLSRSGAVTHPSRRGRERSKNLFQPPS